MNIPFTIIMTFCATAHLVAMAIVAVLAHRRVQYLSLTMVLAIITVGLATCAGLFYTYETTIDVGFLHPSIVLPLAASAFLETMYPLSFIMPGFVQGVRMVKYSIPIIIIVLGYVIGAAISGSIPVFHTFADVLSSPWMVLDFSARLAALLVSIYFIVSLVGLPRVMLKADTPIPGYLASYCMMFLATYVLFIILSIHFTWWMLYVVVLMMTGINLSFVLQSIEQIAEALPRPAHAASSVPEDQQAAAVVTGRDFNDDNLARFRKVEQFMQGTDEWQGTTFTRDRMCEALGFNRHLLLQCLRSQGYNDVHEYITTYRVEYLRRLLQEHSGGSLTQTCLQAGFSTIVTARNAYRKILGRDLDDDIRV